MNVYVFHSKQKGLTRLLVGGLHGREWKTTKPVLETFIEEEKPLNGKFVVVPFLTKNRRYISTLDKTYYETKEGKRLLALIQRYNPDIYIELHCYRKSAYQLLVDPERKHKKGAPPFVELENGVLMGSVSPYLLSKFSFKLAFALEIPCKNFGSEEVVLNLIRLVKDSKSPEEVLERWKLKYPLKIEKAERLLYEWLTSLGDIKRFD